MHIFSIAKCIQSYVYNAIADHLIQVIKMQRREALEKNKGSLLECCNKRMVEKYSLDY